MAKKEWFVNYTNGIWELGVTPTLFFIGSDIVEEILKKDRDVQAFIAQQGLNIPDFSSASARMVPVLACGGSRVAGSLHGSFI